MRLLFLFILSLTKLFSENIYFSQKSLNTDEIEAKIISKIANDLLYEPRIYIVGENKYLHKFLSENNKVESDCKNANFIYIKKDSSFDETNCLDKNKIYFTDNKHRFKNEDYIFGAFFWFKSRPNVRLSTNRANFLDIRIPKDYTKFLDEK